MPEWWNEIPQAVKIGTTLAFIFLGGVAAGPHLKLPDRVTATEDAITSIDMRLTTIETAFTELVRRLDRHFCVQLAEEEGVSARDCDAAFRALDPMDTGRRP